MFFYYLVSGRQIASRALTSASPSLPLETLFWPAARPGPPPASPRWYQSPLNPEFLPSNATLTDEAIAGQRLAPELAGRCSGKKESFEPRRLRWESNLKTTTTHVEEGEGRGGRAAERRCEPQMLPVSDLSVVFVQQKQTCSYLETKTSPSVLLS